MRKSTSTLAFLALVAGCGGSVEAAWVGTYDVDLVQDAWVCGEGGAPSTQEGSTTWEIVEDDSGLYVDTLCRTSLVDVSDRRATIAPAICNGIADDGRRYQTEVIGGFLMRDGPDFYGVMNAELTFEDGLCVTAEIEIFASSR